MNIKLNFINRSNITDNMDVVLFQKNVAIGADERVIAWKVISNCGRLDNHPFNFPTSISIGASDRDGNYTPQQPAQYGQLFTYKWSRSGHILNITGVSTRPEEVQLCNGLSEDKIQAVIYRDAKRLCSVKDIAPVAMAAFAFRPTLWIGAVAQVMEGDEIDPAVISDIETEISLLDVVSADIVMRGGGPGSGSSQIEFTLENVVKAE